MEYQQPPPATTYSKKLANGGSLTGKHVYDGVFGAPAKPGSRMEDYREIFGGSATCSIPILDFPELNERNISIEARGMKPDYSAIFGGFEEAEFAVPYEDMVSRPRKVTSQAREARVPTEARSNSIGPKHLNSTEEKRTPSPEVSSMSFDDGKQFNLSYNKSNPGSKNGAIGTTHIAQLHEVPGYTCLIDESVKATQATLDDACLNDNDHEEIKERKPVLKPVSGPQPQVSAKNTPINSSEIPKKSRRHWSFANDISFDFEIGLGTQTSPPPNIGSDAGSKSGAFNDREGANGSYSPPLLDEEMDANSAAATSAAAVRKAIEEAQAKIRIAKELMERKKHGLPTHVKPSFTNGSKAKRRETKAAEQIKETSKQVFKSSTEKSNQTTFFSSNMKEPDVVKAAFEESNSSKLKVNDDEKMSPSATSVEDSKKPKLEVFEETNNKQENFPGEMNSVEVTFRWDIYRHNNKSAEENEEAVQLVNDSSESSCVPEMTSLPEEYKSQLSEKEDDAETIIQDPEINRKEIEDGVDQVVNEIRPKEGENQEEIEIQTNEAQREENFEKEEFERTECETKQEECSYHENDNRQICDPKPEGTRKRFEVHREEVIGAIRNSLREEEDSEERQEENYGTESDGDLVDSTESEILFQEDSQMNEIGTQTTFEDGEPEIIQTEIHNVTEDNDRVIENSYLKETERESKLDDWVEKENVQTGDMEQGPVEPNRSTNRSADLYLGQTESMFKYQMTEYERGNLEFQFEEVTSRSDENEIDSSSCGTGVSGQGSESNFVLNPETNQDTKENQVETFSESSLEEECAKNDVEVQASEQPQVVEEENKVRESKENLEFVNKCRERKEEMRIREIEREKEKERMVVERAIREVRERAFAEARERAKKTTAEGRERSGKVFSETNAMSASEKASMEAKIRAQRAAVERATAEARERALEKALSEKASSRTGQKSEKPETIPNNKQGRGSGPSKSSGTDSELPERCKATFERNQRTAERAAKALAEKNMRDLLAQKEQAERNRLAEILDAEVKRWATGKERNLRALLSTLQYILGSESGWQPVPLTDLISSAAVKKAYRKATLFVHPDKLQQRGASIQQKYTCEKVFDLLKDAWNKFSSEER